MYVCGLTYSRKFLDILYMMDASNETIINEICFCERYWLYNYLLHWLIISFIYSLIKLWVNDIIFLYFFIWAIRHTLWVQFNQFSYVWLKILLIIFIIIVVIIIIINMIILFIFIYDRSKVFCMLPKLIGVFLIFATLHLNNAIPLLTWTVSHIYIYIIIIIYPWIVDAFSCRWMSTYLVTNLVFVHIFRSWALTSHG